MFISAYKSDLGRKLISKLYTTLEDLKGDDAIYIKERWEKESNIGKQLVPHLGENTDGKTLQDFL